MLINCHTTEIQTTIHFQHTPAPESEEDNENPNESPISRTALVVAGVAIVAVVASGAAVVGVVAIVKAGSSTTAAATQGSTAQARPFNPEVNTNGTNAKINAKDI